MASSAFRFPYRRRLRLRRPHTPSKGLLCRGRPPCRPAREHRPIRDCQSSRVSRRGIERVICVRRPRAALRGWSVS